MKKSIKTGAKERMKRIQEAMLPLIGDSRFQAFIEEVEQQQKAAMIDACNERILLSDRLTLATIGEVRAYQGLVDFYQSQVEQAEARQSERE